MTVTRRSFLRSGAMAVLLTGVALDNVPASFAQSLNRADPAYDFPIPVEAKNHRHASFKRDTFEPYLNGVFTLRAGANSVEATLVSVRDCTPSLQSAKVTKKSRPSHSFALVFRTEATLTDLTNIYDVEHGALGTFPLFLTRRDGPDTTFFYEAVFNHAL